MTGSGQMIQAGVSRIPADQEFHSIKFFEAFPSAPAVFVSNFDPVDMVRIKGETEAEFTASADAGFEDIESHGACAFKGGPWWVSQSSGNEACKTHLNEQECAAATASYIHHYEGPEECDWEPRVCFPATYLPCNGRLESCGHWCLHMVWDSCKITDEWCIEGFKFGCSRPWLQETRYEPNVCVYNEFVIGKCRGKTALDWGSCKQYVTSETECTNHPECVWTTIEAEHTKPLVEVHWMAVEKTEDGVLGAYPFIAGETSVGDDTTVSFDAGFTQVPLVFGQDHGEAKADLRLTAKDVGNFSLTLQGASADEKTSYFVYNGQSHVGTAFKAVGSVISYAYETAEFGECVVAEGSTVSGSRTRTVDCKRSDGETAEDYYCIGERPHETEACVVESFFVMSAKNGRCLGPIGGSAAQGVQVSARGQKCASDKSKFKLESGTEAGFRLVNLATGLCYCSQYAGSTIMHFDHKCNSALCDLEKSDPDEDGTFIISPVGHSCLRTARRRNNQGPVKTIKANAGPCGSESARFTFVKEGSLIVEAYAADVPAAGLGKVKQFIWGTGGGWYKDKSGKMLTDEEHLDGDHPTTPHGHPGVGWLEEAKIDFKLHSTGPIQTVNVGWLYKRDWQIKKPQKLQIQCSADGESFGSAAVFKGSDFDMPDTEYKSDEGGRKVMSFQVGNICPDDTTTFRLIVTPKGENVGKNNNKDKKAVLDEVMAFAPFKVD